MNKADLEALIADDEYGLLESPPVTEEQQAIIDAFSAFILKQLARA